MTNKSALADFLLKILVVSFFVLSIPGAEIYATETPPDDNAEFMAEMAEFLRPPDEPDIYPDDYPNVSDPATQAPDMFPTPPDEMNESPWGETDPAPEDDAIRIARPGDPEPEYPVPEEPDTLFKGFIDVAGDLMGIGGIVKIGIVVMLVLLGMRLFKNRMKTVATVEKQAATSFAPSQKRTATASFKTPDNKDIDQTQIRCSQCDLVISENHKFCTGCGTPSPVVAPPNKPPHEQSSTNYCASCGSALQPGVQFCTNCGGKV